MLPDIAKVNNISRASLSDGPGLRTVVYLKGCSLSCKWCHNPESINHENQIVFISHNSILCGRCFDVCENNCHIIEEGKHYFNRDNCTLCMKCCEVCPTKALEVTSKDMNVIEVFNEIVKDKDYYIETNGGITITGGECLLYPKFTLSLLKKCKEEGINTAIESALNVKQENIEKIINYIDIFIADIKHFDSKTHKKLTGSKNELIKNNIKYISKTHNNIWIRIPLIPGLTDSFENLLGIGKFINTLGESIKVIELLKYNNLYSGKYDSLDMNCEIINKKPQTDEIMQNKVNYIKSILTINCIVRYL